MGICSPLIGWAQLDYLFIFFFNFLPVRESLAVGTHLSMNLRVMVGLISMHHRVRVGLISMYHRVRVGSILAEVT